MDAEGFARAQDFAAWSRGQPPLAPDQLCQGYAMETGESCREDMRQALAGLRAIRPSPDLVAACLPDEGQWRDMGGRIATDMLYDCVVEHLGGERDHYGYATEHHL